MSLAPKSAESMNAMATGRPWFLVLVLAEHDLAVAGGVGHGDDLAGGAIEDVAGVVADGEAGDVHGLVAELVERGDDVDGGRGLDRVHAGEGGVDIGEDAGGAGVVGLVIARFEEQRLGFAERLAALAGSCCTREMLRRCWAPSRRLA